MEPRLELRCEQRLSLKLTQRLETALSLRLLPLQTDAEKDIVHEVKELQKIQTDLKDLYKSIEEFKDRVGKRLRKKNRTKGTKLLVSSLRQMTETVNTDIPFVQKLVANLIRVGAEHQRTPSHALKSLISVLRSPAANYPAAQNCVYYFWDAGVLCDAYIDFLGLLELGATEKHMTRETFKFYLQLLGEKTEEERLLEWLCRELPNLLPNNPTVGQVELSFTILAKFSRLIGHLPVRFPKKLYKAYVCGEIQTCDTLPLLEQSLYAEISEESQLKLAGLCTHKRYRNNIDYQRTVVNTGIHFTQFYKQATLLNQLVILAKSLKEYVALCKAATLASSYEKVTLPETTDSYNAAINFLSSRTRKSALARLPWSEGTNTEDILVKLESLNPQTLKILITLAAIYELSGLQDQLLALAQITEQVANNNFLTWRYTHDFAKAQLKPMGSCPESWIQNIHSVKSLVPQDKVQAKIEALSLLLGEATTAFKEEFGLEWGPELANHIQTSIFKIETNFRNANLTNTAKQGLGRRKRLLNRQYRATIAVSSFYNPIAEETDYLKAGIQRYLEDKVNPHSNFTDVLTRGIAILNAPEFGKGSMIILTERDDVFHTLNLGVVPYPTCQRWTDRTSQNVCTPSHATDADKKVWYFSTHTGALFGRAVVRMAWHKKCPMLILEDIYASGWSADHTRAFVLTIIEKAMQMSRETEGPIYIGYAWYRENAHYSIVFKKIAKEFGGVLKRFTIAPKLAPSLNGVQYSDTLGGKIYNNATRRKVSISILTVDTAAEDEAAS